MSTFRRVFFSSVGTKLLIGLTGLALFASSLSSSHRQRSHLRRSRHVQRVFAPPDLEPVDCAD